MAIRLEMKTSQIVNHALNNISEIHKNVTAKFLNINMFTDDPFEQTTLKKCNAIVFFVILMQIRLLQKASS